ncbi:type VII secretion-associated serine protease mycosin [Mycolicibacterium confluentis]|uniref:Mycosin-4 n=1 Tax=Mycolicibacterium confluentis TaxID=28047 RepID=A0A7I7Y1A7_9MYCO|nr:type VII secretion-associated serine protease mycosin [Mycolicibacterium confluentis]MCV7320089.1 type VII secretion-associated serine protease mycosin [Mycolicibacterium confluentis]ORV34625.1 type VII secretion-associated serine protease mycosin [Mycolicibacterium confluentis]BBZ35124.1 mycosin-4 [Mycolicibacterium confluentis]
MRTVAALLTSAVLAVAPSALAPTAHALTPPVVDPSLLPEPARPVPPRPTVQRDACVIGSAVKPAAAQGSPLSALGIDTLWTLTRGEGQRVAVIDTGVAPHHRLGKLEGVGDYVASGDGTQDCDGHGTVVAGLIAAAPDSADGFSGVAPAATVLSVRQSSTRFGPADEPATSGFGDVDTMARAVRVAADSGATVINISVVACAEGDLADRALGAALAYAVDTKDVVVVTAAGNVGGPVRCPRQPEGQAAQWDTATVAVSPAWYDDYVLTVGSVAVDGAPSAFTLAGPWVDVAAPGEALVSLSASGGGLVDALPSAAGDAPISGTSYAAPIVSGLAALIRSRFPELTARQVMQRIETTAHRPARGWDPAVGNGVIDPVAALSSEAPTTLTEQPESLVEVTPAATGDDRARTIAVAGAGACIAVAIAAWGSSAVRRRGRGDVSPH